MTSTSPRPHWAASDRTLARTDPAFADACAALLARPDHAGRLDARTRCLVRLALSAQVSTLQLPAIADCVAEARHLGIGDSELVEVLELVCQQGMSSFGVGIPIIAEEFAKAGAPLDQDALDPAAEGARLAFTAGGPRPRPWSQLFDVVLRLDPELFEILVAFIDAPWRTGTLSAKTRELVTVAMDVACTHLYRDGLRRHVAKAIAEGATAGELLDVVTMAAGTALASCAAVLSVLDG